MCWQNADAYTDLTMDGTGYLRVRVDPDKAVVEYVATYLPKDENAERKNGQVRYSYTVDLRTANGRSTGAIVRTR